MEYGNINMGGGQQNYVQHSQEPPRVSTGCNPQHSVNTFPGSECGTPIRNYATYPQNYPNHEYSSSQNTAIGSPSVQYQQTFPPDGHSQSLTLNQLLQQSNTSGTYQMRAMHNPQAPYRSYDPYGYPCKPGVPTCVAQDRTQTNPYPFPGPQRYADPYVRSYPPYPPGPNYPYNYHTQSVPPQRHRATNQQMSQMEFNNNSNISASNQPRPSQGTPGNTSNLPERPSSRNVVFLNSSSQSPQNAPHSSPVYSGGGSGSQASPWSPHPVPFGSPPQQTRSHSLSRDYQHKPGAEISESAIKSDNQSEGATKTAEDSGSRPQSRISESGSTTISGLKDQLDDAIITTSLDNLIQNCNVGDNNTPASCPVPTTTTTTTTTTITTSSSLSSTTTPMNSTNASASPCTSISRGTPPAAATQPYQTSSSHGQTFATANSPAAISQMSNVQGQMIPCTSPNQSKPPNLNRQTPPLPRSYNVPPVQQDPNVSRLPHPPYSPIQQQQIHPNSHYPMSGGRMPGFYPGNYPMRSPMHPMVCSANNNIPCRPPHFQSSQNASGLMSTGSMPPPAAPPVAGSNANQLPQTGINTTSNQQAFAPGLPYPMPSSTSSNVYGSTGHNSHSSWDQESQSPLPPYAASQVPSNMQQQFACRPCPPYGSPMDRVAGYPQSPTGATNTTGSVPHNGPQMQPPYASNQSSYHPGHQHMPPYSYPPNQISYHSQTQYPPHPYGPPGVAMPGGVGGSSSGSNNNNNSNNSTGQQQQHPPQSAQSQNSSVPSQYPTAGPTSVGSPMPPHMQMAREPYHQQQHYPQEISQPTVSTANENFTHGPFPPMHPNNGSPSTCGGGGAMRLPVPNNNMSKSGNLGGKPAKILDAMAHSMTINAAPGSPSQVSTASQLPTLGSTDTAQNISSSPSPSSSSQQHHSHQRSLPPLPPGHPQIQQYSTGQNVFPPGSGGSSSSSFLPPASGACVQTSPSFSSFQHQYRGTSPHNMSNSTGNIQIPGSMYSGGPMVPADMNPVHQLPGMPQMASHSISAQSLNAFHKLLEMGTEPDRRPWLEHYVRFMDELGKPLIGLPQVVKQPLDLYRFYVAVRDRGGVIEVIKNRKWKEVSLVVNINASASAAYTLRKNYCKYLLDYECHFDRGGSDPRPILAHIEALSGKKKKLAMAGDTDSSSLSGITLVAPVSPAGSHSSASSSLLPPGSSGASLSGGPSCTAGSAASDSQHGPSSQQQRFSDPGQPGSVSTVPESPNGTLNVPSPSMQNNSTYLQSANSASNSAPSPQRPPSCAAVNGYPNTTQPVSEPTNRLNSTWSWPPDGGHPDMNVHRQRQPSDAMIPCTGRMQLPSAIPVSIGPNISAAASGNGIPVNMNFAIPTSGPTGTDYPIQQQQQQQQMTQLPPSQQQHQQQQNMNMYPNSNVSSEHLCMGPQSPVHQPRLPNQPNRATGPTIHSNNNNNNADSGMYRMHQFRPSPSSVVTSQVSPYQPTNVIPSTFGANSAGVNNTNNGSVPPAHLVHHHGQRPGYVATIFKRLDHFAFPPGCIEATQIEPLRHRRYRTKDLGPISAFKVLMALRSGLTAEISWALNILNILLRDDNSADFVNPTNLPSLLTCLVDIWRHTLGELFDHDLFVTSLELPTDLSRLSSSSLIDKSPDVKSVTVVDSSVGNTTTTTTTVTTTIDATASTTTTTATTNCTAAGQRSSKKYERYHKLHYPDLIPNGLNKLEQDIIKLAAKNGLSVNAVRGELRRLMRHHHDDSKSSKSQMRLRNGLVFRLDNLHSLPPPLPLPSSTVTTTPNNSATVIHHHHHSITSTDVNNSLANNSTIPSSAAPRSRKRGKNSTTTTSAAATTTNSNNVISSSNTATLGSGILSADNYSGTISNLSNFVSLNKTTDGGGGIGPLTWTTPQIISIADSLRSPEAFSNLRDLSLYAIESLMMQEGGNKTDEVEKVSSSGGNKSLCPTKQNKSPLKSVSSKSVSLLQNLILKGGGDTTCHVMPPFGALAYRSTHWTNNVDDLQEKIEEHKLFNSNDQLSTVKPDTNGDGMVDCPDKSQPVLKRARLSSNKSLNCSSPNLTSESVNAKIESNLNSPTFRTESFTADHSDELDFLQLVDENGRCPLRAREELVYQGSTCMWPDNCEADSNEARALRCLCVSTVLRNLSFINPAEYYLSSQKGVLALVGRLMLLGHDHVGVEDTWHTLEEKTRSMESSRCCWWTPTWLEDMRENALVLLVNVAGYLELVNFDETIVRPILEGLLHWITCTTAAATDPLPGHRTLSPRRLALEAVNRLCVHETNVDLLLSTPSNEDILKRLFDRLANWLALQEDQVTRELALSTLHYLAGGSISYSNPSVSTAPSKVIVHDNSTLFSSTYIGATLLSNAKPCPITSLLAFIEAAESTTRQVIDHYGVQALQERPELMGTSLEMVRRAGALLDRLASDYNGRAAFTPDLELRLMDLVTSRVLDATVAHLLCGALHKLFPATQPPQSGCEKPTIPPIPTLSVVAQLLKLSDPPVVNVAPNASADGQNDHDHADIGSCANRGSNSNDHQHHPVITKTISNESNVGTDETAIVNCKLNDTTIHNNDMIGRDANNKSPSIKSTNNQSLENLLQQEEYTLCEPVKNDVDVEDGGGSDDCDSHAPLQQSLIITNADHGPVIIDKENLNCLNHNNITTPKSSSTSSQSPIDCKNSLSNLHPKCDNASSIVSCTKSNTENCCTHENNNNNNTDDNSCENNNNNNNICGSDGEDAVIDTDDTTNGNIADVKQRKQSQQQQHLKKQQNTGSSPDGDGAPVNTVAETTTLTDAGCCVDT